MLQGRANVHHIRAPNQVRQEAVEVVLLKVDLAVICTKADLLRLFSKEVRPGIQCLEAQAAGDAEMDGFDSSKGLVILAATNRPEVLDKALLRPGRFDRRVIVERPDLKGRVETLKVHAKNVKMDETVNFDEIALATSGAVGSDLAPP